jgi:hypothetical protein
MGEMADYMINGDDCQVCGEYMGEGDGYPRTCAGCSRPEKNDNDPADFLALKKPGDLDKLATWLEGREFNRIKTGNKDRKGQPMIGLSYQVNEKKWHKRGLIVCANADLVAPAMKIIEQFKTEKGGNQ